MKMRKIPIQSGVVVLELEVAVEVEVSGCILSRSKTLRHIEDCCGDICSSSPIVTRKFRC